MNVNLFSRTIYFLPAILLFSCRDAATPPDTADQQQIQTSVTVTNISRDTMSEYIELNATASFLLKSPVKANANGYLQTSTIHRGQAVSRGQVLFTIKTKEAQSIGNVVTGLDSTFRFTGTNSIRASEDGFITQLDHQPGDYVQDGEQLAVISTKNSFAFLMNMPYELRPYVVSQKTVVLLLPDGEKLQGAISGAMPSVDSAAQTQSIVIKVNSSHTIPENLVAKVRILKILKPGAVTVPKSAILTNETQTDFWIMKLIDSATAVKVPVKKGIETADRVEIISPVLTHRDMILTSGNYGLEDTARVKIMRPQQ